MWAAADSPVGVGFESLTVDGTAGGVAFTAATYSPSGGQASRAVCTLEDASIRFTYDGTAPTTTVGHLVVIGGSFVIEGYQNLVNFRAIRTTGTSGTLKTTFER